MLLVDESQWPLVVVRWRAPICGCDLARYRECFADWLRYPSFALVSVLERPAWLPACMLRQMADWLYARRRQIAECCRGIASVLPMGMLDEAISQDRHLQAAQQSGCVARAFTDQSAALVWAMRRLRSDNDNDNPMVSRHSIALPPGAFLH